MARIMDTSVSGNALALAGLFAGLMVACVVLFSGFVAADLAGIRLGALPATGFFLVAYLAGVKTRRWIISRKDLGENKHVNES